MRRERGEEPGVRVEMGAEERIGQAPEPPGGRPRAPPAPGGVGPWRARWLADALQDVRHAARRLRRRPGFTAMAIVTLALGIGANTAVFSVVEAVLLKPLPYPGSDDLLTIHNRFGNRNLSVHPWTPDPVLRELKRSDRLEAVAGYAPQTFAVTDGDRPYELEGAVVTAGFFRVFRAEMEIGRGFAESDTDPGAPRTVVISHDLWQGRFGGSPDVIGRTIRAETLRWPPDDAEVREIIGVLELGFRLFGPRVTDPALWIPYRADTPMKIAVARLRDGVTLQQVQSELDVLNGRIRARNPDSRFDLAWTPLKAEVVGGERSTLLILQAAAGTVLLIACVNLTSLLLARGRSRHGDVAIRRALGASRGRLLRQHLTEGVVLALLGAVAASLVLFLGMESLPAVAPAGIPRLEEASIDGSVLLWTLASAVGIGLVVGTVAAMAAVRREPGEVLGAGARAARRSRAPLRVSRALVVAEVALVVVLLVGAGLLVRSFASVASQDPGFRTRDVVVVRVDLPGSRYRSVDELAGFYRGALERVRHVPGVESATLSLRMPVDRGTITEYRLEGAPEGETRSAQFELVTPGYFRIMDIPLVRGRTFRDSDRAGARRVAIVDQAMAGTAWPNRSPIGRRLRLFGMDEPSTVVGVVGSIRASGPAHEPRPGIYLPLGQGLDVEDTRAVVLVRTGSEPSDLAGPLREAIWDVDPRQPVAEITTLERVVRAGVSPYRFRALLLGSFGTVATLLAIAGIYGVVEQLALLRRYEIGIRMALGARASDVLRMVVGQGAALAAIGMGLGLLTALALGRALSEVLSGPTPAVSPLMPQPSRMLHGVGGSDPLTLLSVLMLMSGAAVLASYVPARRAAQTDPLETLGAE